MPTTASKNILYRVLLPFAAPGCGPSPLSSVTGQELLDRRGFTALLRRHHVLGAATLLSDGKRTSLVCSSSVRPPHTAFPDTFFRVASITKTATAVLSLRLADEGILHLDGQVGSYFFDSAAVDSLQGITLRHLLSHTSGLVDPPDLESSVAAGIPFPELVRKARPVAPGTSFRYSNLGFGLIGCILEAILNLPVGRIFQDRLFEPLKMNATLEGCLLPRDRIMPVTRILPWHPGSDLVLTTMGSCPLTVPDPLRHYGHTAGSMYTDIASLYTLLRTVMDSDQHFLSVGMRKEMTTCQAYYGRISPTLSYGLGMLIISDPALSTGRILGHQGFAYGCADGAFWEENTGRVMITLNGGCSEARSGRLGSANRDFLRWAFHKEIPAW